MLKKTWKPLIILLWAVAGIVSYGGDKYGQNLPAEPKRIVLLAPNVAEIAFALGLDDEVVAVSTNSDYPPEAVERPSVGNFWQPNIEAIIAARPDLVVTLWFEQQRNIAQRLGRMGYGALTLKIESMGELLEAIEKIGEISGRERQSKQLVRQIKERCCNIRTQLASTDKVKVLWVVQAEPLRVAGRATFVNELIELAGGENAIGRTIHKYPPIGVEQVIASGAEVIIQPTMGTADIGRQEAAALKFWSRWKNVPAVKNNRIYVVPADTVSRLGPRVHQGLEMIARRLHPEIFGARAKPE